MIRVKVKNGRATATVGGMQFSSEEPHKGHWIHDAIKDPGSLHRMLGVPEDEDIPIDKIREAATKGGLLGKRAHLALTLMGLSHKKKK